MSDRDEPVPEDPQFEDPPYDELRALLAEARVTDPVPAEVAARLDDTLASLQAERAAAPARVVPLRRRFAPALVAAAAAVVVAVGGFGIARAIHDGGGGSADSTAAQTTDRTTTTPLAPTPGGTASERAPEALSLAAPRLSTATFRRDAARYMRSLPATGSAGTAAGNAYGSLDVPGPGETSASKTPTDDTQLDGVAGAVPAAPPVVATPAPAKALSGTSVGTSCSGPAVPGAVVVPATLDGRLVALLFRPPSDTGQRVEAWSCDGTRLLVATTVPR